MARITQMGKEIKWNNDSNTKIIRVIRVIRGSIISLSAQPYDPFAIKSRDFPFGHDIRTK